VVGSGEPRVTVPPEEHRSDDAQNRGQYPQRAGPHDRPGAHDARDDDGDDRSVEGFLGEPEGHHERVPEAHRLGGHPLHDPGDGRSDGDGD
jgi:hypothetical protein